LTITIPYLDRLLSCPWLPWTFTRLHEGEYIWLREGQLDDDGQRERPFFYVLHGHCLIDQTRRYWAASSIRDIEPIKRCQEKEEEEEEELRRRRRRRKKEKKEEEEEEEEEESLLQSLPRLILIFLSTSLFGSPYQVFFFLPSFFPPILALLLLVQCALLLSCNWLCFFFFVFFQSFPSLGKIHVAENALRLLQQSEEEMQIVL
jgi:hypothetical protein